MTVKNVKNALVAGFVVASMILGGFTIINAPLYFWVKCGLGAIYCFVLAIYFSWSADE